MTETTEKKKEPSKGNRLSRKQWQEIAAIWAMGEMRLIDISERYGVARETISRKMKQFGVKYGEKAEEHRKQVHEEMLRADTWNAKVVAKRQIETKEFHYNNAVALSKAGMKIVADALKSGLSLASVEPDLKSLERALNVQKMAFDQKSKALGMDQEEQEDKELPELVIRGMTEEELEEVQREAEARSGIVPIEQLGEDDGLAELEALSDEEIDDLG